MLEPSERRLNLSLPLLQHGSLRALFLPCEFHTDSDLTGRLFQYAFSKPIPNEEYVVLHQPSLLCATGQVSLVFDKEDFWRYEPLSWFGLYFCFTITEIHHQEWAPRRLVRWACLERLVMGLLLIGLPIAFRLWLPLHLKGKAP